MYMLRIRTCSFAGLRGYLLDKSKAGTAQSV